MPYSKRNKLITWIFGAFLCCIACISVFGQWSGALGSSWNNPTSASISRILIDRMNQRLLAKRLGQKQTAARSDPTPSGSSNSDQQTRSAALRSLKFNSTPTRIKLDSIVANLGGAPDQRVQTKQLLIHFLDTYDKEAAALGYKNDLPLSFASFILMSAAAYRGADIPGDEKLLELRAVIAESALESGVFKSITDRQKQEISEILVVFGSLAFSGYVQSKQNGDVSSMNAFKELGGLNLKTVLGLNPDDVQVEPGGVSFATASAPQINNSTQRNSTQILSMLAGDLVKAFEENEIRANQMFGGKRIRVQGTVNSVASLPDGRAALIFRSTITTYGMAKCFFDRTQKLGLSAVTTNAQLIVEGTVKEYGGGWDGAKAYVILEHCTIP